MAKLWSLEFNIFVMMAVGFLIRRIRLVGKEAERVITDLVLYLVLPCSISIPSWESIPVSAGQITSQCC